MNNLLFIEYMEISSSVIWLGFIIALTASVSTFLGAMTSLYFRSVNQKTLSVILGFAGGIMLYIAFMKLMPDAISVLSQRLSYQETKIWSSVAFFLGITLLYPLGYLANFWKRSERAEYTESIRHERHIAILILTTISAHSFVEGVATFLSILATPWVAVPLVMSIIMHNFPEGMTIGALFNRISDTMGRKRAIIYSLISALVEPLGAMTAYIFIMNYSTPVLNGLLRAFLAGLLVATALNELIPNSQVKGSRSISMASIIAGMFIMASVLIAGTFV